MEQVVWRCQYSRECLNFVRRYCWFHPFKLRSLGGWTCSNVKWFVWAFCLELQIYNWIVYENLIHVSNFLLDYICEETKCEKVATLGDCYYCVSGCPTSDVNHAWNCVQMGLKICKTIKLFCIENPIAIQSKQNHVEKNPGLLVDFLLFRSSSCRFWWSNSGHAGRNTFWTSNIWNCWRKKI